MTFVVAGGEKLHRAQVLPPADLTRGELCDEDPSRLSGLVAERAAVPADADPPVNRLLLPGVPAEPPDRGQTK
jgi:hypothetical protein